MRNRNRRAFTLVELLVVIGIIALLLSILLPALSRARETAYRVMCMSNQRQLYLAVRMYSDEWKGAVPFCNWLHQESGGGGPWTAPGWLYTPPAPATAPDPAAAETFLQSGSLYKYIRNPKVYRCPLDPQPWVMGPVHPLTSYGLNGAVNGFGYVYPPDSRVPFFKIGQFRPDDLLIWELDETYNGSANIYNDGSNFPLEGITMRHGVLRGRCATGAIVTSVTGTTTWILKPDFDREANACGRSRLWCVPKTASLNGHMDGQG